MSEKEFEDMLKKRSGHRPDSFYQKLLRKLRLSKKTDTSTGVAIIDITDDDGDDGCGDVASTTHEGLPIDCEEIEDNDTLSSPPAKKQCLYDGTVSGECPSGENLPLKHFVTPSEKLNHFAGKPAATSDGKGGRPSQSGPIIIIDEEEDEDVDDENIEDVKEEEVSKETDKVDDGKENKSKDSDENVVKDTGELGDDKKNTSDNTLGELNKTNTNDLDKKNTVSQELNGGNSSSTNINENANIVNGDSAMNDVVENSSRDKESLSNEEEDNQKTEVNGAKTMEQGPTKENNDKTKENKEDFAKENNGETKDNNGKTKDSQEASAGENNLKVNESEESPTKETKDSEEVPSKENDDAMTTKEINSENEVQQLKDREEIVDDSDENDDDEDEDDEDDEIEIVSEEIRCIFTYGMKITFSILNRYCIYGFSFDMTFYIEIFLAQLSFIEHKQLT